jgi:transcriptional regulator with XRE-family HTH domain
VISPYVRRLRLATEIRALREKAGLTGDQLAKRIGRSRADVSRLENGHVIDQADVIRILDLCGVEGDEWTKVMTIAREAGESGWWESFKTMGDRQAMFANLEAGAATIREYQQTLLPGLMQTPEFALARTDRAAVLRPLPNGTPDGIVAGRLMRQRMLRRPDGPEYEAIIDELAIRRLGAPPAVVKKALYHVATVVNETPRITVRVLPIGARIEGYATPITGFTIFTFPDPDDPVVVAISSPTVDFILTEPGEIAPYEELFDRLRKETLSEAESLDMALEAAHKLADE